MCCGRISAAFGGPAAVAELTWVSGWALQGFVFCWGLVCGKHVLFVGLYACSLRREYDFGCSDASNHLVFAV